MGIFRSAIHDVGENSLMKFASFSSEADRVNRLDREVLEKDRDLEKVQESIARVVLKHLEDREEDREYCLRE